MSSQLVIFKTRAEGLLKASNIRSFNHRQREASRAILTRGLIRNFHDYILNLTIEIEKLICKINFEAPEELQRRRQGSYSVVTELIGKRLIADAALSSSLEFLTHFRNNFLILEKKFDNFRFWLNIKKFCDCNSKQQLYNGAIITTITR